MVTPRRGHLHEDHRRPNPPRKERTILNGETEAVQAIGVSRSFGGVHALADASLSAHYGEVHALVGENGAGKSTLIKILGGVIKPDAGQVRVHGENVTLSGPSAARRLGVGSVFQELALFPWMTVAENLFMGAEPRGATHLIQRRYLVRRAEAAFERFGVEGIEPRALAASLPLAQRQVVEVTCALLRDPRILLLDEPTSALAEHDVAWLFRLVRELRDNGACIIFTSHRWAEIKSLADRITILRNGTDVATRERFAEDEAVTLMTGRTIDRLFPSRPPEPSDTAGPVLEARGLVGEGLRGVSFKLRPGEIVGVGGLAGQGQRELFLSLFGAQSLSKGEILVGGVPRRFKSPADAISHGIAIALVPEDRKTEGLMLPMSVRDNLTLAVLGRISHFGVLAPRREATAVSEMVGRLQIRTTDAALQPVGKLSGGNQQKVLIGRWLLTEPKVLLVFDITRGVDIGTKHDIYQLMVKLASEGKTLLYYSSETEEIAQLCHRVLVMRGGRIVTELSGAGADAEAIVAASLHEDTAA
jgi:ribose transport system ATP-binding protein